MLQLVQSVGADAKELVSTSSATAQNGMARFEDTRGFV
jgi:hypothetical protein